MGFFDVTSKTRLPLRGRRKKLPLRGKRGRRLNLLREFEVGQVYTFVAMHELDDLPDDTLLWADDDYPQNEVCT